MGQRGQVVVVGNICKEFWSEKLGENKSVIFK
jgi:hypothetical protein